MTDSIANHRRGVAGAQNSVRTEVGKAVVGQDGAGHRPAHRPARPGARAARGRARRREDAARAHA
jgi:hypothetical protein